MAFRSNKKVEKDYKEITNVRYEEVVEQKSSSASYIGQSMKIKGDLSSEENITIEGQLNGTINASNSLTIGRDGNVSADITAKEVIILGKVKGNILGSEKVTILPGGRFNGNLNAEKLVVTEGAFLMGEINKGKTKKSTTEKKETKKQ